jgi:ParB/RepB/Spo0J family partition protein
MELTLIPAPTSQPNDLPGILNMLTLDDGSTFGHFNTSHIINSPTNRKRFNESKLKELAASVKEKGVVQPILIRPLPVVEGRPQMYELIAGERRWRAAIMASIAHIPAICRQLSDHDAIELEEAEGYERLMMTHGYTADQLADRLKKSRSYIYGRLKLCALSLEVREPFLEDQISASTALLIARIPVPELQNKALQEILKPAYGNEPLSYRAAAAHIAKRYTLDLEDAPFDPKDAKLLSAAGSCSKCPKLTGNQPVIYADAKSANVCTDPDCFEEKTAAHYQRVIVIANKRGIPILEGNDAFKIRSDAWRSGSEFVIGATHLSSFAQVAPSTGMSGYISELLTNDELPKPAKYIKENNGEVQPVYAREEVQKALEKKGLCETAETRAARLAAEEADPSKKAPPSAREKQLEAQRQREAEQAEKARVAEAMTLERVATYRKLREKAKGGLTVNMLRELAKALILDWSTDLSLPGDVMGDLYPFEQNKDATCAFIDQADATTVQLLIMDMIVGDALSVDEYSIDDDETDPQPRYLAFKALASLEKVDGPETPSQATPEISAEPETSIQPDSSQPRPKLTLKDKSEIPREQTEGPVIKVRKNRAAQAKAGAALAEGA